MTFHGLTCISKKSWSYVISREKLIKIIFGSALFNSKLCFFNTVSPSLFLIPSIGAGPSLEGPAECGGYGSAGGPGSSPPAAAAEQRSAAAHLPVG